MHNVLSVFAVTSGGPPVIASVTVWKNSQVTNPQALVKLICTQFVATFPLWTINNVKVVWLNEWKKMWNRGKTRREVLQTKNKAFFASPERQRHITPNQWFPGYPLASIQANDRHRGTYKNTAKRQAPFAFLFLWQKSTFLLLLLPCVYV